MDPKPILKKLESIEKTQGQILLHVRILVEQKHPGKIKLPEIWYDDEEVMFKMHWSKSTLKRRRAEGLLPYTKIRNKFYYKEEDVFSLLSNR